MKLDPAAPPRLHRRTFLKLGAALGAAVSLPLPRLNSFAIASSLPLPIPHTYFAEVEALLRSRLSAFDALLVPAYVASELIRRAALQRVAGPPGRAHDPDGAFSLPYATAIAALVYRGAPPQSLADLWQPEAVWPDSARLVIGAALLRRGCPLNDTHPGHLAQVEKDLLALRPRLVRDPLAAVRSGRASLGLALLSFPFSQHFATAHQLGLGVGALLPPEGAALVEYDWVVPLNARQPHARDLLGPRPRSTLDAPGPTSPLIPLTPLPQAALAQRQAIWSRVKHIARYK